MGVNRSAVNLSISNHGSLLFVVCLEGEDVQKEETATFYMFSKTPGMNSGSMINLKDQIMRLSIDIIRVNGPIDIQDRGQGHHMISGQIEDIHIQETNLIIDQEANIDLDHVDTLDLGQGTDIQGHVLEVENIQDRDQDLKHEENLETGAQFHFLIDIEILGQDQMRDIDIQGQDQKKGQGVIQKVDQVQGHQVDKKIRKRRRNTKSKRNLQSQIKIIGYQMARLIKQEGLIQMMMKLASLKLECNKQIDVKRKIIMIKK